MTTSKTGPKGPNLYQLIHKSIRLKLSEYLLVLGQGDAANAADRQQMIAGWTRLKAILDNHAHHEDTHLHALIELADINVAMTLRAQHTDFDHVLAALEKALLALDTLEDATDLREAQHAIYLDYSAMMADYFRHLVIEETQSMPALLAKFTVPELMAAHGRLIASIPPEELLASTHDMARSISLPELIVLMQGSQASAPPAFFTATLGQVKGAITPAAYSTVCRALNREAA